eukprot:747513-Hanusia_phi.AAC.1
MEQSLSHLMQSFLACSNPQDSISIFLAVPWVIKKLSLQWACQDLLSEEPVAPCPSVGSRNCKMDIETDECMELGHGVHVGAPMPETEDERLRVLKMINILDSEPEADFDR